MISCLVHDKVNCDNNTPEPKQNYKFFSMIWKVPEFGFPYDFDREVKSKKQVVEVLPNEKSLLDMFITKIKLVDPDFIVCHGLTTGMFEILLSRINFHKVSHWSWLGRFKWS